MWTWCRAKWIDAVAKNAAVPLPIGGSVVRIKNAQASGLSVFPKSVSYCRGMSLVPVLSRSGAAIGVKPLSPIRSGLRSFS